ncbi:unnamed protein product, partial [Scytosiphon promiscuus]
MGHCRHALCMKRASFNTERSKPPAYCKQHAADGMVNVVNNRCIQYSCTTRRCFNVVGSKTAEYCGQHAADGM